MRCASEAHLLTSAYLHAQTVEEPVDDSEDEDEEDDASGSDADDEAKRKAESAAVAKVEQLAKLKAQDSSASLAASDDPGLVC